LKRLETRKTIALAMAGAYIFFTAYGMVANKEVPTNFVAIVGPIIGYYFGKSTALEMPKKEEV
jgi:hypothetical protein